MGIRVKWTNHNTGEDYTNVYRSRNYIDLFELPEPIAQVGPGVTEFDDLTVPEHEVWHYRFGVVKNGEEVLSENQSVYTSTNRGPGPQELLSGDYHRLGYFGTLTAEEFINGNDLRSLLGIGGGTNYSTPNAPWSKVFHDGKIKFFPQYNIATAVTWKMVYESGAVFSEPGYCEDKISPDIYKSLVPTDQGRIIIIDGHALSPRLFSMWDGEWPGGRHSPLPPEALRSEYFYINNLLTSGSSNRRPKGEYPLAGSSHTYRTHSNGTVAIGQETASVSAIANTFTGGSSSGFDPIGGITTTQPVISVASYVPVLEFVPPTVGD